MNYRGARRIVQSGFTLITALFLLVVVAVMSVYLINFSTVQHTTLVYSVQGARAMQAARTGLEWGVYQVITTQNCNAGSFSTSGAGSLDNFNITVTCVPGDHPESGVPIRTFRLTSSASTGAFGSLDYVFRSLQATVSNQPP